MLTTVLNKEVFISKLGKIAKIRIYPEAQEAIDKNWESLYFSNNDINFAEVEIDDYIFSLDTHGEVRILSVNIDGEEYRNEDVVKIKEILDNGQIEGSLDGENGLDRYTVDNNNWFAVVIAKINKREVNGIQCESIDDEVFEACPNNVEELEKSLIEYAISLYEQHIS